LNTISAAHDADGAARAFTPSGHGVSSGRSRRWAALLDRIAAGDGDAVAILYDESSSATFSLILHVLQDRRAAERALVDTYVRIRDEARARDAREGAVAWILAVARRAALNRLQDVPRSDRPVQWPTAAPAGAAASVLPFDARHRPRQEFGSALDLLNPRQRTIIRMAYFGGLTVGEVAEQLKLSSDDVRSELGRAMTTLRKTIAGAKID